MLSVKGPDSIELNSKYFEQYEILHKWNYTQPREHYASPGSFFSTFKLWDEQLDGNLEDNSSWLKSMLGSFWTGMDLYPGLYKVDTYSETEVDKFKSNAIYNSSLYMSKEHVNNGLAYIGIPVTQENIIGEYIDGDKVSWYKLHTEIIYDFREPVLYPFTYMATSGSLNGDRVDIKSSSNWEIVLSRKLGNIQI